MGLEYNPSKKSPMQVLSGKENQYMLSNKCKVTVFSSCIAFIAPK